jgi:hypothetical protein
MTVEEFTPREHFHFLAEFLAYEQALNGPDGHLVTLGPLLAGASLEERIWRCGLYAAVYNVPTAEAIWQQWSFERALRHREDFRAWVVDTFPRFSLRRERRAVRTPAKFAACVESLLEWIPHRPGLWDDEDGYETAWVSTANIYGMGRYIRIKLLEAFHRHAGAAFQLGDIRASGGHSPRAALAMLYPRYEPELTGGDTKSNCAAAEMCARWAREELSERHGLEASWFELQVALCEYKSEYNRNQYPGRTLDSELVHWEKARALGHESRFLDARAQLFPAEALGERQGWSGRRKDLHECLRTWGYTWSDTKYSYHLSKDDLSRPIEHAT